MMTPIQFGARHFIPMDKDVVSRLKHNQAEGDGWSGFVHGDGLILQTDDWGGLQEKLTSSQVEELKESLGGNAPPLHQDNFEYRSAMHLIEGLTGRSETSNLTKPQEPRKQLDLYGKGASSLYSLLKEIDDIAEKKYLVELKNYEQKLAEHEQFVKPVWDKAVASVQHYFASRTSGWL